MSLLLIFCIWFYPQPYKPRDLTPAEVQAIKARFAEPQGVQP